MKKIKLEMLIVFVLATLFSVSQVFSQPAESEDKTLSPYFFVTGADSTTDRLPLKATTATVNISGVIADVLVTQIYKNEGTKTLEAIYIFPASTRAAVYGMKMTIGKRVIAAKIKKREEARRDYEKAREQGKSASLLEQQRPNVFQMNVANIMPGDEIKVEMKYTELLVPEDKVYEFVYPTVVGPRYSNQSATTADPAEKWVENPYLRQGELSATTFDINVNIAAGMPIKDLACSSHIVQTTFDGAALAKVALDKKEKNGGNRDYILRYRLAGDKIQTGLLLSQSEKENFFVLMMQPPQKVTTVDIPGREYVFIVDVSGSMHGFPLEISKKLLRNLISKLRPDDCFNVLLFSGSSHAMSETSLPATAANVQKAIHVIDSQYGGGSTEILPALKKVLSLKKPDNFARTIVIVTDGYVTVEEEVFDLIRKNLSKANLFAFGIGTAVNRHIIEGMAHVGMGESFVIEKPEKAEAQAARFLKMIQSPVLTQVKIGFSGFQVYDVEPMAIPDVLAQRPVVIFGKWRGKKQGIISLEGISGTGRYTDSIKVEDVQALPNGAALQYLWARHRIMILSDYNKLWSDDRRVKEVTELGLKYNLLTAYTSFVAVDNEVRNHDGKFTTVKQPLPLPEGVSDYAVGKGQNYAPASPGFLQQSFLPHVAMKAKGGPRGAYDERYAREMTAKEEDKKDAGKGAAKVIIEKIMIGKDVAGTDVHNVVQNKLQELEKCFAGIAIADLYTFKLTVQPDGTVRKVVIVAGTINDKIIKKCIIDQIKKWRFPAAKNGQENKITITLKIEL